MEGKHSRINHPLYEGIRVFPRVHSCSTSELQQKRNGIGWAPSQRPATNAMLQSFYKSSIGPASSREDLHNLWKNPTWQKCQNCLASPNHPLWQISTILCYNRITYILLSIKFSQSFSFSKKDCGPWIFPQGHDVPNSARERLPNAPARPPPGPSASRRTSDIAPASGASGERRLKHGDETGAEKCWSTWRVL